MANPQQPPTFTPLRTPDGPPSSGRANLIVPAVLGALVLGGGAYLFASNTAPPEPGVNAVQSAPVPSAPPQGSNGNAPPPVVPPVPAPVQAPANGAAQDVSVHAAHPEPTTPDPHAGRPFTLAEATRGIAGSGALVADIETDLGTFNCTLMSDRAPNTVANFVGLATGTRDFWDPVAGRWTRRAYYDGSVFHRVIPEFMIQGGDILRNGSGGPGYEFADENVDRHDEAGLLCMANRGPGTNGSQFFILEAPKPYLDHSYSVFGRCTPVALVQRIARVPRSGRDVPVSPVYIRHVRVHH